MNTELEKRMQEIKIRMNKALQFRKNSHCPIFGANEKSKPYLVGTGVGLELGSNIFIASAAHVFDENDFTTLYTFIEGEQITIEGEVHATTKPENDRDKDKLDVAVFKVSEDIASKFRSTYLPVAINDVDVNDIPSGQKYYVFIGHPTNKTKPKYGTTTIKSEMFSYFGSVSPQSAYKQLSISQYSHIVIGFDPNKCLNENGTRYNFPKAKGMSGGGVWLLEDLNNHSSKSH